MPSISINQIEYSTEDGLPVIHIFGRDDHGEAKRLDVTGFRPYFFVSTTSSALKALPSSVERDLTMDYTTIKGEPCTKLWVKSPSDVRNIRDKFVHYEADIVFTNRFQIDTKLKSGVSFPGDYCCDYQDLKPVDVDYPTKTCIVDIECSDKNGWPDSAKDPIICITCYDSFDQRYTSFLLVDNMDTAISELEANDPLPSGCFNPDFHAICLFTNETSMLKSFAQYIKSRDPDVLTGWNFTGFDMPYILGRFSALHISAESLARISGKVGDRVAVRGRQIFDLLLGYKRMHLTQKESYRLDAIAFEELGRRKIHFTGKVSGLSPSKLLEYNFVDVELCVGLEKKDEIVGFHIEIAKYVGCSLDKTLNSMPIIDTYILRKAHGRYVLPSKTNTEGGEEFEGAAVFEPKKGLHENVIVLDLKSLYPMIMMTGNMSPDTKDPKGEIVTPIGVRFRKKPDGLVREIQAEFLNERDSMKAKRNTFKFGSRDYKLMDMKQNVVKVLMNSYYGVSGNSKFRLYDREIGASITAVGREILEHGKKLIQSMGYEVAMGDTDSAFVITRAKTKEEAITIARQLEKMLNDSYPAFAKKCLNADVSYFSVKFEKFYSRFFSGGRKKRYAGLLSWKEGKDVNEIDIVGFEIKRSDTPVVTKKAQKLLMEKVLKGENYEDIRKEIREILKNYRAGKYSLDEIGIPGGIGKALEDYDTKDAQVRGAEYANKHLGANFGKGSKPKRIYLKAVPPGYEKTDVICFEYGDQVPLGFVVDMDVMLEKTLQKPLERIMEGLGWNWNEFNPALTTLSQWGF
jgi:DNA polymerase, archaea type